MGYRSEVAIKCEEKAFEVLKDAYKKVDFEPDKIYKDDDCFILYWDWVKWYGIYEEVQAIEKALNELDKLEAKEESGEYGYKFLRLGENDDDIESRENNWDLELYIIRQIDIPQGLEEVET